MAMFRGFTIRVNHYTAHIKKVLFRVDGLNNIKHFKVILKACKYSETEEWKN